MSPAPDIPPPAGAELPPGAQLEPRVRDAARLLKLMANEPRLMILCKLGQGEQSVSALSSLIRLGQSATSQHLSRMRAEGLVETRRVAQTIYYRIANPAASEVMASLCRAFD
ncbi:MAG: ArsR/SmtB family transcription factor, partial [Asticcacaulis sp.]